MSTPEFVRLLGTIRAHLSDNALDARISSVEVSSFDAGIVEVRLHCGNLAELAAALVAWAGSLTRYYPWAWRNPYSGTVHLRLTGQLPDYTGIGISGAVPDTDTTFSHLQPGGRQYFNLTDLTVWAAGDGTVTP